MKKEIDIIGIDDSNSDNKIMHYIIDGHIEKRSKLYYKPYSNNFKYGLYFIARFSNRTTKRIYLNELPEYK